MLAQAFDILQPTAFPSIRGLSTSTAPMLPAAADASSQHATFEHSMYPFMRRVDAKRKDRGEIIEICL